MLHQLESSRVIHEGVSGDARLGLVGLGESAVDEPVQRTTRRGGAGWRQARPHNSDSTLWCAQLYRAVTLYCLEHNLIDAEGNVDHERLIASLDDIHIGFAPVDGANHTLLDGRDVESEIRGMEVSERVSTIATIGEVRRHLVSQQQAMGRDGGVVMDGRDIGTVVFPHAQLTRGGSPCRR